MGRRISPERKPSGWSEQTAVKQAQLRRFLRAHFQIVRAIWRKYGKLAYPEYVYVDTNAGSGMDSEGEKGSPLIFLDEAVRAQIPFRTFFFEYDAARFAELEERVQEWNDGPTSRAAQGWTQCVPGDHMKTLLPALLGAEYACLSDQRLYGLVYADPNGHVDLPVDPLTELFTHPQFAFLDVLLRVPANSYKRGGLHRREGARQYSTDLVKIGKKVVIVQEPLGQWQWTFAILTNWDSFPSFQGMGFRRLDSPAGQRIMERLCMTKEELEELEELRRKNGEGF